MIPMIPSIGYMPHSSPRLAALATLDRHSFRSFSTELSPIVDRHIFGGPTLSPTLDRHIFGLELAIGLTPEGAHICRIAVGPIHIIKARLSAALMAAGFSLSLDRHNLACSLTMRPIPTFKPGLSAASLDRHNSGHNSGVSFSLNVDRHNLGHMSVDRHNLVPNLTKCGTRCGNWDLPVSRPVSRPVPQPVSRHISRHITRVSWRAVVRPPSGLSMPTGCLGCCRSCDCFGCWSCLRGLERMPARNADERMATVARDFRPPGCRHKPFLCRWLASMTRRTSITPIQRTKAAMR